MVVKQPSSDAPSQQELDNSDTDAGNWLTYGKGYRGARYSALTGITTANVSRIKPVCSVELSPEGSFEGSPVAYQGTLYVTTTNGTFAIDGRTCAKIWSYQYDATDIAAGANNKGVAIGGGRVIRGTTDGHLIALDIKTGDVLWDRKIMDSSTGASAMAAPLIWHDLVFMGVAGGDVGVRGEVAAYRVADGTKVWSFSTIPMENETGANTWKKTATASHGGGGVWTYFTLDPKSGTIFAPVGNPWPDYNADARPGANLFTTGIVALDASSGKLRWSYQTQPNDDHDWDATGSAEFDMTGGKKILAVTSKDGLVHLIDLSSGKLVSKTAITTIANADAPMTTKGTHFCPGLTGGSEWNGAAWHPATHLVYVNSVDWCVTVKLTKIANITNIDDRRESRIGSGRLWRRHPGTRPDGESVRLDDGDRSGNGQSAVAHQDGDPDDRGSHSNRRWPAVHRGPQRQFLSARRRERKEPVRYDTKNAIAGGIITYSAGGTQYVAAAAGNTSFFAWKVTGKPTLFIFGL